MCIDFNKFRHEMRAATPHLYLFSLYVYMRERFKQASIHYCPFSSLNLFAKLQTEEKLQKNLKYKGHICYVSQEEIYNSENEPSQNKTNNQRPILQSAKSI
ncbi:hypothetical protein AABB24_025981 [Solanum stoloniferum]|uniref:Uncharacterized protein n=1 Tax=Solanum stoloniferum TaxID=62892 RepID=A0ABD2SD04_9SOLN